MTHLDITKQHVELLIKNKAFRERLLEMIEPYKEVLEEGYLYEAYGSSYYFKDEEELEFAQDVFSKLAIVQHSSEKITYEYFVICKHDRMPTDTELIDILNKYKQ